MDKEKSIARCGLWCGACRAYLLKKKDLFEEKSYKRGCSGCWIQNKNCAFLKKKCRKLGKTFDFCFECDTMPCASLKRLNEGYVKRYHVNIIENLKRMQEISLNKCIVEQEELYKYFECGDEICVHNFEYFDRGLKYDPNINQGDRY